LLPCAAVPLAAATKHPAAHNTVAVAAAQSRRTHAPAQARSSAHRNAEIARAEKAQAKAQTRKPAHVAGKRAAEAAEAAAPVKAAHLTPREALAAKAAAYRSHAPVAETGKPAMMAAKAGTPPRHSEDVAADPAVQDQVHAWMRSRGVAEAGTTDQQAAFSKQATISKPQIAAAKPEDMLLQHPVKTVAKVAKLTPAVAPEPDLSTTAHKATAEDFDRAARQRVQSLRAAATQNQSRTTADDDAAALAATQIPSTAPTARVAAPFTHGELLGSATSADFTARQNDFTVQPETLTTKAPTTPTAVDAGVASTSNRVIATQTAVATAPKLQLSKPAPIVRQAPAATALANAAKHPRLDTQVAAEMADDAFASDTTAPAATTPVTLTTKALKADPASRNVISAPDDGDLDTNSTGSLAKVDLYDSRGRLRMLPAMKGTHEILVHQNQMALADGLDRIEDDDQLYDMRRLKLIVALPDNDSIQVNDSMPANRRYARPWSVRFLNDLARAHYARFHTPLTITSAVRTVAFQKRLMLTNGNAAPPSGETASPHLYGQAIDLGKHGMSMTEIAWMRAYLTPIESAGKIDVEEEFQQACFHISVYRRYLGLPTRKNTPQPDAAPSRTLLQAKSTPAPAKHRRLPNALLATGLR
jgi:hypothetical protein